MIDPISGATTYSQVNYKFEISCDTVHRDEWSTVTVTPNIKAKDMNLLKVQSAFYNVYASTIHPIPTKSKSEY